MNPNITGISLLLLSVSMAGCVSQPTTFRANTSINPARYRVVCEGEYEEPPQLASGKAPVYPISMLNPALIEDRKVRHLPMEWPVTSTFTVGADGSTDAIQSTVTTPVSFGEHMTLAVRSWRFTPARAGDEAVPAKCKAGFTFTLG
ncbi:hypothetical protein GCM10027431_22760 [Lysobacter rhizosphaerae]